MQWNRDEPEVLKIIAFMFDMPVYSKFFLQLYMLLFSNQVSIDSLLFEAVLVLSKYYESCFLHRNWNLDCPKVAKVLLVETNLVVPCNPS